MDPVLSDRSGCCRHFIDTPQGCFRLAHCQWCYIESCAESRQVPNYNKVPLAKFFKFCCIACKMAVYRCILTIQGLINVCFPPYRMLFLNEYICAAYSMTIVHDDVIIWRRFPHYSPLWEWYPTSGRVTRWAVIFLLLYARKNQNKLRSSKYLSANVVNMQLSFLHRSWNPMRRQNRTDMIRYF